ncbi:hypothetical protein FOXB_06873, partial [Fusarium oxysporum f. sp. conglutinans Fo5176]
NISNKLLIIS